MSNKLAYVCQSVLLVFGLIAANLTYADYNLARLIVGAAIILEIVAVIWFWKTFRTRK